MDRNAGRSADEEDDRNLEYLNLATRMGVPYSVIETFMASYAGSVESLQEQSMAAMESTFVAIDSAFSAESAMQDRDGTMATPMSSPGNNELHPEALLMRPFAFDRIGNLNMNVNTGMYTYRETDLFIPGVNGLDLHISRRFDSQFASTGTPMGYRRGTANPECFTVRYLWLVADPSNPGQFIDFSNQTLTFLDYGANPRLRSNFTASQYDFALAVYNGLVSSECVLCLFGIPHGLEDCRARFKRGHVVGARTTWNSIVAVHLVPIMIAMPHYTTAFGNAPFPYNYTVNNFGLGHGWHLGFSAIETFWVGSFNRVETRQRLVTADGRRFELEQTIGFNTSEQVSNLVDYPLLDMRLFRVTDNDFPGARHALFHADGRIEYFNDMGRNIAIVDRFGNAITLAYTYANSDRHIVASITITDTLGNVIVFRNENIDINNEVWVFVPGMHFRYNVKWTLSLNGDLIQTYYVHDYRRSSIQQLRDQGFVRLVAVRDEVGDLTVIINGQRELRLTYFYKIISTQITGQYGKIILDLYFIKAALSLP